jgi:2-phospho-L-lactate guanylyltransferase (CobY/MobA/RfbA family)
MTTVVVLADPEATLPGLEGVLDPETRRRLARASLTDVCQILQHGEADVLVNYPDREGAESALRELLAEELPDPEAVRYEVQAGSDRSARLDNALGHLLESEAEPTVGFAAPTAPFLRREHVGTLAMKLRTSDVVLGPAPAGGVTLAGLAAPVPLEDALGANELLELTRAGRSAGLEVDFLAMTPRVETPEGLASAVALASARREAERGVPLRTAALFEELELTVGDGTVERSDRS